VAVIEARPITAAATNFLIMRELLNS
jgi:hypothetical protein